MQKHFLIKCFDKVGGGSSLMYIFILCFLITCVVADQVSTTTEDDDLELKKSYPWRWQAPLTYLQRRNLFSNEDNFGSFDDKVDLKQDADISDTNANVNTFNDNQYLESVMQNLNLNDDFNNKRRSPYFSLYNID